MIQKVTVFCGYSPSGEKGQHYIAMAKSFGEMLAKEGFALVSGGNGGMMTAMCQGAHGAGAEVHCITLHKDEYPLDHSAFTYSEDFVTLTPRQQRLLELADAYVALPGGIGTHYEIFEVLCKKGIHEIPRDRPFICVGEEFEPLRNVLQAIVDNGMSYSDPLSAVTFVPTLSGAIEILKTGR